MPLPLLWSGYGCWDLLPIRHTESLWELKVVVVRVAFSGGYVLCWWACQSFGLCDLTCFPNKNFLKVHCGCSLGWIANGVTSDSQIISSVLNCASTLRGSFSDDFIKSELHRLNPSAAAHLSRGCIRAYDWCQHTLWTGHNKQFRRYNSVVISYSFSCFSVPSPQVIFRKWQITGNAVVCSYTSECTA